MNKGGVRSKHLLLVCGVLWLILLTHNRIAIAQSATAKEQIALEVGRLKQLPASLKLIDAEAQPIQRQIARLDAALQSGYLYLSLYLLRQLRTDLMTLQYQRAKADVEKQGVDGFEAECKRVGEQIAEKQKRLNTKPAKRLPALAQALAEISLNQVQPLHTSGRLYGLNTTIGNGLYYLGLAQANLDFVLFCQTLTFEPRPPLKVRSLKRQLTELDAETVKAFEQADSAAGKQPYIFVNSSLKIATELERDAEWHGALVQYLSTYFRLNLIKATLPDDKQLTELQKQNEAVRLRLATIKTDSSVGLLYSEMAQEAFNNLSDEDFRKRAAVIVERVLPRYFDYLREVGQ